jgi:hypothetical protein
MTVQLKAIKLDGGVEQRRYTTPLSQQHQSLRKSHLVVQLDEANHVTATAAAIAVEQALVGIDQKAGLVVGVQRTQSQPAATAQCPRWPPLLRLQIIQQRNCHAVLNEENVARNSGALHLIKRIKRAKSL